MQRSPALTDGDKGSVTVDIEYSNVYSSAQIADKNWAYKKSQGKFALRNLSAQRANTQLQTFKPRT